jgi:AcrR family transcriptional regulator
VPRPRDPAVTAAALDAALALLAERGCGGVTMDAIAARAGVGKPALYRRFADKAELVVAAIGRALPPMPARPPVAADPRSELRALVERATPADPEGYAGLIGGLMAERVRHPELIETFRATILRPRRAVVRAAVERGQRAGALRADLDPEVAVDLLGGAFLARAFAGLPVDDAWRGALFAAWWAAVEARPKA